METKILKQLKNRNFYFMVIADMILFSISLAGAYFIRFDFILPKKIFNQMLGLLIFIVPFKFLVFFWFDLYRGMWRYSSISDMYQLFKATLFSSMAIMTAILFLFRFQGFSRGVFLIDAQMTFILTGGLRILIRLLYGKGYLGSKNKEKSFKKLSSLPLKNVILVGAGDAGEKTLREIKDNPSLSYKVIGFVDDDKTKHGRTIHGVRVLGSIDQLPEIVSRYNVEEILITMPSATGVQMRRVVNICENCKVPYRTLPSLGELIDGRVSVKAFRDVNYSDLLRREPVEIEIESIKGYLKGKTILVTGAGGSIGSELCRQIIRFNPALIVLLDASEYNLYSIQMEFEHRLEFKHYEIILANIRDKWHIEKVIRKYKPEVIIHAAAYKHVPILELHPWMAVFNNILGTKNLLELAVENRVERVIMISTDKAVNPANVMGASKRVCELLAQALEGENGTRMICVRFGNVIGSSGSVVPLFKKQIEEGGPVTVTHPEVRRFFMTIPEACQLILQAGAMGNGGEIFILDMGEPIRILDIAKDLIRLAGKEPDRDIEIKFIGLRPGEKLYEELITQGEGIVRTEHKKIWVLRPNNWFGHKNKESFKKWLYCKIAELEKAAYKCDNETIRKILKEIVPEYNPIRNPN